MRVHKTIYQSFLEFELFLFFYFQNVSMSYGQYKIVAKSLMRRMQVLFFPSDCNRYALGYSES